MSAKDLQVRDSVVNIAEIKKNSDNSRNQRPDGGAQTAGAVELTTVDDSAPANAEGGNMGELYEKNNPAEASQKTAMLFE